MIKYVSTRGKADPQSFEEVLLAGMAPDGGLYMPEHFPQVDLSALAGKSYAEIAMAVMGPFTEGAIPKADLKAIIARTYSADIFHHKDIVPLHPLKEGLYVMEQFHGPTLAFKDVALQLLGRLFDYVLTKRGAHLNIIGATSGDTGSAAIEGCRHCDHLDIFILHPAGKVSEVQRRQMTTVQADNVHNIALDGTFDDCQDAVKAMFADEDFRRGVNMGAINSINWARIMAQIVYYFDAALKLGAPEKEITFVVPTGNFGNVFAGFCAREMGLPIKLVVATNENDILARFFHDGEMRVSGVKPTITPSMDIEISSNFERYLYMLLGRDPARVADIMVAFKAIGNFTLSDEVMEQAKQDFQACRVDEAQTRRAMKDIYAQCGYVLDPHSAIAVHAACDLVQDTAGPLVALATAHPAKFPESVGRATGIYPQLPDHLEDLFDREEHVQSLENDLEMIKDYILKSVSTS